MPKNSVSVQLNTCQTQSEWFCVLLPAHACVISSMAGPTLMINHSEDLPRNTSRRLGKATLRALDKLHWHYTRFYMHSPVPV
jgi:hypothetical protein